MPAIYSAVPEADRVVQEQLADVLERRLAEPAQRAMRESFHDELTLPPSARVLEVGCGTGAIARMLAARADVAAVVGLDQSLVFLERARRLAADIPTVSFMPGDAHMLPFADGVFDLVMFSTSLSHIVDAKAALGEAQRVLDVHGQVAIFDGDYATTTVCVGEDDPLGACADAWVGRYVGNRWLFRELPALMRATGFDVALQRTYVYVENTSPSYMLTIVDRGADVLAASERIGAELAAALKTEARRRAVAGRFVGRIDYGGVIARKARPV